MSCSGNRNLVEKNTNLIGHWCVTEKAMATVQQHVWRVSQFCIGFPTTQSTVQVPVSYFIESRIATVGSRVRLASRLAVSSPGTLKRGGLSQFDRRHKPPRRVYGRQNRSARIAYQVPLIACLLVFFLIDTVRAFMAPGGLGEAIVAPLSVRVRAGKFRDPDIGFMLVRNLHRAGEKFWIGTNLVMEVVIHRKKSREREPKGKRSDYAKTGIAEYWIVDASECNVILPKLREIECGVHGTFATVNEATSVFPEGLSFDVADLFTVVDHRDCCRPSDPHASEC